MGAKWTIGDCFLTTCVWRVSIMIWLYGLMEDFPDFLYRKNPLGDNLIVLFVDDYQCPYGANPTGFDQSFAID
jgi:hypothetical protein